MRFAPPVYDQRHAPARFARRPISFYPLIALAFVCIFVGSIDFSLVPLEENQRRTSEKRIESVRESYDSSAGLSGAGGVGGDGGVEPALVRYGGSPPIALVAVSSVTARPYSPEASVPSRYLWRTDLSPPNFVTL